jgi:hypothetical protein
MPNRKAIIQAIGACIGCPLSLGFLEKAGATNVVVAPVPLSETNSRADGQMLMSYISVKFQGVENLMAKFCWRKCLRIILPFRTGSFMRGIQQIILQSCDK